MEEISSKINNNLTNLYNDLCKNEHDFFDVVFRDKEKDFPAIQRAIQESFSKWTRFNVHVHYENFKLLITDQENKTKVGEIHLVDENGEDFEAVLLLGPRKQVANRDSLFVCPTTDNIYRINDLSIQDCECCNNRVTLFPFYGEEIDREQALEYVERNRCEIVELLAENYSIGVCNAILLDTRDGEISYEWQPSKVNENPEFIKLVEWGKDFDWFENIDVNNGYTNIYDCVRALEISGYKIERETIESYQKDFENGEINCEEFFIAICGDDQKAVDASIKEYIDGSFFDYEQYHNQMNEAIEQYYSELENRRYWEYMNERETE